MADLFQSFRAVVAALDEARIPFAVCGGLAMSIHARPRATIDIDLLVPAEAVPPLVAALEPLGFVRREREPTRLAGGTVTMHCLTKVGAGDPDVLVLDVLEVGSGGTAEAWAGREAAQSEGHPVTVVTRGGLVALKRLRNSPQDQADIAALEEP